MLDFLFLVPIIEHIFAYKSNRGDNMNGTYPETYFCIDQKSFYASVECVERQLDPMTALPVVADAERSKNTICLAVSVGCKKKGIKNRCRLGDIPPNMNVIVAPPRMQLYIDCAAEIHGIFLKYFAPEDIYTYSIGKCGEMFGVIQESCRAFS